MEARGIHCAMPALAEAVPLLLAPVLQTFGFSGFSAGTVGWPASSKWTSSATRSSNSRRLFRPMALHLSPLSHWHWPSWLNTLGAAGTGPGELVAATDTT